MKTFDLSHFLDDHMSLFPGSESPGFIRRSDFPSQPYREMHLSMSTHSGTHMDAPAHMIENGKFLDEFEVSQFMGKAVKINIVRFEKEKWLPEGTEFLILETGWSKHWGTTAYLDDFPCLSKESVKFLKTKNLKGIGVDAISFDPVESTNYYNHYQLLGTGMIFLENLSDLSMLPDGELFDFFCFPLKIRKADGSPVRVIAII
ncbi:MAG: cyclase family protein [Bacteroidales bacterium]|nr:cyclase family protein [Bacteroidales bacterium]